MKIRERIRAKLMKSSEGQGLPNPALPPSNRGSWDEAALTNVAITELVKRQIRSNATPQQK